ncbi:hypothetical protein [Agarilytica rhodophyticola]|uniref:hypothetical protein n=1 Tax=Agarilytica rhodophyticola TaxID=1737490 RepID=UPI000B34464A|nr:hypothetical protein [Agarilytica rhodophyticola]
MANYRVTSQGVQCKTCNKIYPNKDDFKQHFSRRHATSQRPALATGPNILSLLRPRRQQSQIGTPGAGPASRPATQRSSSPTLTYNQIASPHLNAVARANGQSAPKIYQLSYSYGSRASDRNYTQSLDHKMLGKAYAATIGASNSSSPSNPRHLFHGVHASDPTRWNSLSPLVSSKGFWAVAPNPSNLKNGAGLGEMQGVIAYAGDPSKSSRFVTVWKTDQSTFSSNNVAVSSQQTSPRDRILNYNGVNIPYQEFKEIHNMADRSQKSTVSTHFSKSDYTRITLAYCLRGSSSNRDFARSIMDVASPSTAGLSLEERINKTNLSRDNHRMSRLDNGTLATLSRLSKDALVSFDRQIKSSTGGSSSPPRVNFVSGDNSHGVTYIAKPPAGSSTVQGLTLEAIYQLP